MCLSVSEGREGGNQVGKEGGGGQGSVFYQASRGGPQEKVAFQQGPEQSFAEVWGGHPGRGNSKSQGPRGGDAGWWRSDKGAQEAGDRVVGGGGWSFGQERERGEVPLEG